MCAFQDLTKWVIYAELWIITCVVAVGIATHLKKGFWQAHLSGIFMFITMLASVIATDNLNSFSDSVNGYFVCMDKSIDLKSNIESLLETLEITELMLTIQAVSCLLAVIAIFDRKLQAPTMYGILGTFNFLIFFIPILMYNLYAFNIYIEKPTMLTIYILGALAFIGLTVLTIHAIVTKNIQINSDH